VPIEYSARGYCGGRYLIFNPGAQSINDAEGRARARAAKMHARFVVSATEPFVMCECGQALDFSKTDAVELMM
jgi:hypothetical protein